MLIVRQAGHVYHSFGAAPLFFNLLLECIELRWFKNILSQKEKIKKRIEFYNTEEKIKLSRNNWNNIRKKNLKDLLIERYVIKMRKKYCLTIPQSRHLLSLIFIAIVFKVITSKDIIYENGQINDIKGIEFKRKQIILKRNLYDLKANFSPEIIIDKKIMSEHWSKYLEGLRKSTK